jgi:DNA-binding response OmpR family regulator
MNYGTIRPPRSHPAQVALESATGRAALEMVERDAGPIDLLVTDVVMPEMNGRELATRLTALRPDLRVLFMSGYTDDVIARRGVLEAGTELLAKPFGPSALVVRVRSILHPPA